MRPSILIGTAALCCLLAACNDHSDEDVTIVHGNGHVLVLDDDVAGGIHLGNGEVTVRASGQPDAVITADGKLRIGQQAIAVDASQQALLKYYYDNLLMIRSDGIATGKAGAAVGEEAASSVLKHLANGDPDQIQQDIDAKVRPLKQEALKICADLGKVKASQDQLANSLPAFKPYGNVVSTGNIDDCRKDNDD